MNDAARPHPYAELLERVAKPARYTGGEVGAVVKDWADVEATFCLAFPDVYDIGMSHLGCKILYKILNDDPRTLAERCYCPWIDLEGELRRHDLPLLSLESRRPLRDFDVVGFSLQFELTYSNVLTMLDLGGIPLRSADRGDDHPLVLAGGPTATHPEPMAAFIDAFVIGDGEEKATEIALAWTRGRAEGLSRRERLGQLARLGGVYVPSLYSTAVCPDTGLVVVDRPLVDGLPLPIERCLVDLDRYPFPDDGPTGGPEAIFERTSIEIARGCTEGCRFCQAGMIYRPVRERDPQQIVDTVLSAVKKSGQDEVSLTALSTADVSCISPLIKTIARRLAAERVTLGVSSLRAYGLDPELLDELQRVRAVGLTFAPEAGTQRMRDVVNKNVTEEQLLETAHHVFSRGWSRMKLYFMIGLPTETDDDVRGIVETGARTAAAGRRAAGKGKPVNVTVSVSTHVPKPHTPLQWCAMDDHDALAHKQRLLRDAVRPHRAVSLRVHDAWASILEGVFARGDRRLCGVLERAWRAGARFDSWDDQFKRAVWEGAFAAEGIDPAQYLGTLPVTARLPWDHIHVGLEPGFLAREYRKALHDRLSPPCGKVAGALVHPATVEDAEAERRRLVCYDCGVACDLDRMRARRVESLARLGAYRGRFVGTAASAAPVTAGSRSHPSSDGSSGSERVPAPRRGHRYRFRYEKLGSVALLGHLDLIRALPRVLRRLDLPVVYTGGFHPKPDMTFGPALGLGVSSLDEHVDMRLDVELDGEALAALPARMTAASPAGLVFRDVRRLSDGDPTVSRVIAGARYLLTIARSSLVGLACGSTSVEAWLAERCAAVMAASTLPQRRDHGGVDKIVDVRPYLLELTAAPPTLVAEFARRAGILGDLVAIDARVRITPTGATRPMEIAAVVTGQSAPPHRAIRVELFGLDAAGRFAPTDISRTRGSTRADGSDGAVCAQR